MLPLQLAGWVDVSVKNHDLDRKEEHRILYLCTSTIALGVKLPLLIGLFRTLAIQSTAKSALARFFPFGDVLLVLLSNNLLHKVSRLNVSVTVIMRYLEPAT